MSRHTHAVGIYQKSIDETLVNPGGNPSKVSVTGRAARFPSWYLRHPVLAIQHQLPLMAGVELALDLIFDRFEDLHLTSK